MFGEQVAELVPVRQKSSNVVVKHSEFSSMRGRWTGSGFARAIVRGGPARSLRFSLTPARGSFQAAWAAASMTSTMRGPPSACIAAGGGVVTAFHRSHIV